jgi:outer membrane protein OmpA-like peptidoglycan-associated protein
MLPTYIARQKSTILFLILFFAGIAGQAQKEMPLQPKWWFGLSGAANFNAYRGTTQMLNESRTVPTAFHKGSGIRPYISLLTEYRPNKVWGGMLNVAFDNRGGKFDGVEAPCNCAASLSTDVSYLAIEPSIRLAPFHSSFYVFAGPTLNFNLSKSFAYTQERQTDISGDWSGMHETVISAQAGVGMDFPISSGKSAMQMSLSPFASFQTDFGHEPRSVESWSFYTFRAGVAFKFGKGGKPVPPVPAAKVLAEPVTKQTGDIKKQVQFSVRAPKVVPLKRKIKETFVLRNSVFFDPGSAEIPSRYILLTPARASSFKEEQLQEAQPDNLNAGRSSRQLVVYHNILNIMGDRMRTNPRSSIILSDASVKNPAEGKRMEDNIRQYLVAVFGIDGSRILTEERDRSLTSSEQPGGTRDLEFLREGNRRVDIISTSPELLMQVGGITSSFLKPVQITAVQEDPLDSHVIFSAIGAEELLSSWSVEITDEQGIKQTFGPYTKDQASVSGKTILGANAQANYSIFMLGKTKEGDSIRRESSVSLMKMDDPKQEGLRYSILFEFDKSKTIDTYEKFLTDVVTPLIPENGTVIIHGHTDIIGDEKYNQALSHERAVGAEQIMERALANAGKKGIKFETYGFGKDPGMAPFENNLPEERSYNRTVIIDIIPGK